ncbi:MAG: glycine betaine ABC transporter substrate-binding protein, partial [Acidobacteriota bacterium]
MKTVVRVLGLVLLTWIPMDGCGSSQGIVIGSKNFTEQVILGELLAQQIENKTDLPVRRQFNLGGTFICDQALRSGEIDGYVEYTGTAFTAILKNEPIHDSQLVYDRVKEEYLKVGIEWMEPLGFDNTFAILIRNQDARRLEIRTISQAAPFAPGWLAAFGYEFIERADGFAGLSETYDLVFQKPPRVMELGLTYRALAGRNVDLIAGDATNGLIAALDLFMLEDDKSYFPPYDGVPVFRSATLERYPQLREVLLALSGTINEGQMRRMNFQVDGEERMVHEVVEEFLETL